MYYDPCNVVVFHCIVYCNILIVFRDDKSGSHLLKVEIVMEGPTYFIVIGDAGEVPPPIRIDNLAEVCTIVSFGYCLQIS